MYTTLDIIIVCVLGGCALALYLACIQHYRELKVVQNAYREAVDELEQVRVAVGSTVKRGRLCCGKAVRLPCMTSCVTCLRK